jgi:hypothetical protein
VSVGGESAIGNGEARVIETPVDAAERVSGLKACLDKRNGFAELGDHGMQLAVG